MTGATGATGAFGYFTFPSGVYYVNYPGYLMPFTTVLSSGMSVSGNGILINNAGTYLFTIGIGGFNGANKFATFQIYTANTGQVFTFDIGSRNTLYNSIIGVISASVIFSVAAGDIVELKNRSSNAGYLYSPGPSNLGGPAAYMNIIQLK
jgi:hypothetical protein